MRAYSVSTAERIYNRLTGWLLRLGLGPKKWHLLTVVGRRTGRAYSTPVTVVAIDGQRWLVAPYREVAWVKNALAAGTVLLSRRGVREHFAVDQVDSRLAAPVLKAYLRLEPITRRQFGVDPNASVEAFEAVAPDHPVLAVSPLDPKTPRQL